MDRQQKAGFREEVVPWDTLSRKGTRIIERARALPADVQGPHILKLVERIERLRDERIVLDVSETYTILTAEEQALAEVEIDLLVPVMRKLLKTVPPSTSLPALMADDVATWRTTIDVPFMAAMRALGAGTVADGDRLAHSYRLLLNLSPTENMGDKGGRAPLTDALYYITRTVVIYRYINRLDWTSRWSTLPKPGRKAGSPFTDEECIPVSDTALLLRGIIDAFDISARNVTLRNLLERYIGQLEREKRSPTAADLLVIEWREPEPESQ